MVDLDTTIIRLSAGADARKTYCCMAEVPTPWRESLCMCQEWLVKNLGHYVEGYHMELASGEVVGHIYYALTPQALLAYDLPPGRFAIIYCEWVQRRFQGQGLGRRLFDHFLEEMQTAEVGGILVEASDREGQMHYSEFIPRGFSQVSGKGSDRLLYLPLSVPGIQAQAFAPRLRPIRQAPVEIVILSGYLCPYEVSTLLLLQQVAREYGNQVSLHQEWLTPASLREYGVARGIFINGRQKLLGGETEQEVRLAILEEL